MPNKNYTDLIEEVTFNNYGFKPTSYALIAHQLSIQAKLIALSTLDGIDYYNRVKHKLKNLEII